MEPIRSCRCLLLRVPVARQLLRFQVVGHHDDDVQGAAFLGGIHPYARNGDRSRDQPRYGPTQACECRNLLCRFRFRQVPFCPFVAGLADRREVSVARRLLLFCVQVGPVDSNNQRLRLWAESCAVRSSRRSTGTRGNRCERRCLWPHGRSRAGSRQKPKTNSNRRSEGRPRKGHVSRARTEASRERARSAV